MNLIIKKYFLFYLLLLIKDCAISCEEIYRPNYSNIVKSSNFLNSFDPTNVNNLLNYSNLIYPKNIKKNSNNSKNINLLKNQERLIFSKTISEFINLYPNTKWIQVTKNYPFDYPEFPLYREHKEHFFNNTGFFRDISIFEIPNGIVSIDEYGFVFVNDIFISETRLKFDPFGENKYIIRESLHNIKKVEGRVIVINHLYSWIYGQYMFDILGMLALFEICKIEYDYLYIPYDHQYQKEVLDLWGIDTSKIIPLKNGENIQADTIILSTAIAESLRMCSNLYYYPDFILKYAREKLLAKVQKMNIQIDLPEKIFISRKDTLSKSIPNEDEVFGLFESLGYKRYEFSKLNMAEKILISNHAKRIISFVGSGSTNILFASSGVKFYEIFQVWIEATFFYIAKILEFDYGCLDGSTLEDLMGGNAFVKGRKLSIELVKKFIQDHPEL
jgi:hypothetical protein